MKLTPAEFQELLGPASANPTDRGCWLWQTKIHGSYPVVKIKGVRVNVRRTIVEFLLPPGKKLPKFQVRSHCNDPACVNPEHLFISEHGSRKSTTPTKEKPGAMCTKCKKVMVEKVCLAHTSGTERKRVKPGKFWGCGTPGCKVTKKGLVR